MKIVPFSVDNEEQHPRTDFNHVVPQVNAWKPTRFIPQFYEQPKSMGVMANPIISPSARAQLKIVPFSIDTELHHPRTEIDCAVPQVTVLKPTESVPQQPHDLFQETERIISPSWRMRLNSKIISLQTGKVDKEISKGIPSNRTPMLVSDDGVSIGGPAVWRARELASSHRQTNR